jgi:hypothetical protein
MERVEAHDVCCRRLPARLRNQSGLQGAPDAIWQVDTPAGAVRRIYLLLTKEAAVAPSVGHLDDFRAAREVEKSIISTPKSVLEKRLPTRLRWLSVR